MTASKSKKNKYEIDMCNGTVLDKLISFSIPLMLSSILQLLFNAVDIVVVGRFSGSRALAAVGSTTALINVFTNLFIGVSLGANVLAARFYATKQEKQMSETVHTAVTFALISGIVVCGSVEIIDDDNFGVVIRRKVRAAIFAKLSRDNSTAIGAFRNTIF